MSEICCACLSTDRDLRSLNDSAKSALNLVNLSITNIKVCWECVAHVVAISKFRKQVLDAQLILEKYKRIPEKIRSLSSLKIFTKCEYDAIFHESQTKCATVSMIHKHQYNSPSIGSDVPENSFSLSPNHLIKNYKLREKLASSKDDCFTNDATKEGNNDPEIERKRNVKEESSSKDAENALVINENEYQGSLDGRNDMSSEDESKDKFTVQVMTENELEEARESDRLLRGYANRPFKCETCIIGYLNGKQFSKHMSQLHTVKGGPYECDICLQHFKEQVSLQSHTKAHYTSYLCSMCTFTHHKRRLMEMHFTKKHDKHKKYPCGVCKKEFSLWTKYKEHLKIHNEFETCQFCELKFRGHHTSKFKEHVATHTGTKPFQCAQCDKAFRTSSGLNKHNSNAHSGANSEALYCVECDMHFKNASSYKHHLKMTAKHRSPDVMRFKCLKCGKGFYSRVYLQSHMDSVHLRKGNYICTLCRQAFHSAVSLRKHKRKKHEGKIPRRNYVCDLCGKILMHKAGLTQHMNSHLGLRPYKCDFCESAFSYSGVLYTHRKLVHLRHGARKTNMSTANEEQ